VKPEAYTNSGALFKKKKHKITITKLRTKVNIYFGPLPGPWEGPVQVMGL